MAEEAVLVPVTRASLLTPAKRRIKTREYRPFGVINIRSLLESEMIALRQLMQDKKGNMWFGFTGGVFRLVNDHLFNFVKPGGEGC